jgi:two-component system, chemotaxis family, chemotaxis protein CheY
MIDLDDGLALDYLAECREQLAAVEADLFTMEGSGGKIDGEIVSRIFRAVHWVQGGAGVFNLVKIGELARLTENVLVPILSHKMIPTPERVRLLLRATGRLRDLIENPGASNQADIAEMMGALSRLYAEHHVPAHAQRGPRHLQMLLVEDDFASRLLLQAFLSGYGECHVAVNGREGVQAFRFALEHGQRYDLICMDIMMPEMDGREAVRQIRGLEAEHGILSTFGAKIIMTTAVEEVKEVIRCFHELCDSYLTKPVDLGTLMRQMKTYELIQ